MSDAKYAIGCLSVLLLGLAPFVVLAWWVWWR